VLERRFLEAFNQSTDEFDWPLKWFDLELTRSLGVDVYSTDFPKAQGYKIYRGKLAEVLVLKLEMLSDIFSPAVAEFLHIDPIEIMSANRAANKKYYPVYKRFKEIISLPKSYLEEIYTSKYVQHFYSASEIEEFINRWQ
jgi:hypothetical protein